MAAAAGLLPVPAGLDRGEDPLVGAGQPMGEAQHAPPFHACRNVVLQVAKARIVVRGAGGGGTQPLGRMRIAKVVYDPPGTDTENAETIPLVNRRRAAQLKGFRLRDESGASYVLPRYRIGTATGSWSTLGADATAAVTSTQAGDSPGTTTATGHAYSSLVAASSTPPGGLRVGSHRLLRPSADRCSSGPYSLAGTCDADGRLARFRHLQHEQSIRISTVDKQSATREWRPRDSTG